MVTPPPSISTRRRPRAASASRIADGSIQPSAAGSRTTSTPSGRARSQACTTSRRAPSSASTRASSRQPAARVDHHPRRARALDQPHREPRVVAERGAHADQHRVGERPAAVQVLEALGPGDRRRVAGGRGDAAVERLADLGEEVGRAAAVGGERRVERPGGAGGLGSSAGAGRRAGPSASASSAGPDLVGHLGALHVVPPRPCWPSPQRQ